MYYTGIRAGFSATHTLHGVGVDEHERHAHTYRVDWIVSVADLDELGFGVDIDLLTAQLQLLARQLDGAHLNQLAFFVNDGAPQQPSVIGQFLRVISPINVRHRGSVVIPLPAEPQKVRPRSCPVRKSCW